MWEVLCNAVAHTGQIYGMGLQTGPCQIKILDALQKENTTGSWVLYSSIVDWNARREVRTSGIIFC